MPGPCIDYVGVDDVADEVCGITDPVLLEALIHEASEIVYALSGRQFPGPCPVKVRPCRESSWGCPPVAVWPETWSGYGSWGGHACCSCGCNCLTDAVILPINTLSVDAVTIDGKPMLPTEWALISRDHLVRVDGTRWPRDNNLTLADDQPGTWTMNLTVGSKVPDLIRRATTDLVAELAMETTTNPACKLPSSTTSVSRQGVTLSMDQRMQQVREAGAVVPSIAMVMGTYNVGNERLPSDVLNPDTGWIFYTSSVDGPAIDVSASDLNATATVTGNSPTQPTDLDWGDA